MVEHEPGLVTTFLMVVGRKHDLRLDPSHLNDPDRPRLDSTDLRIHGFGELKHDAFDEVRDRVDFDSLEPGTEVATVILDCGSWSYHINYHVEVPPRGIRDRVRRLVTDGGIPEDCLVACLGCGAELNRCMGLRHDEFITVNWHGVEDGQPIGGKIHLCRDCVEGGVDDVLEDLFEDEPKVLTDGGTRSSAPDWPPFLPPDTEWVECYLCGRLISNPSQVEGLDISSDDEYYPEMVPVCRDGNHREPLGDGGAFQ